MAIYFIWRIHRSNRQLAGQNRQLYERIWADRAAVGGEKISENQSNQCQKTETVKKLVGGTSPDVGAGPEHLFLGKKLLYFEKKAVPLHPILFKDEE
jgi:hypothetical protein